MRKPTHNQVIVIVAIFGILINILACTSSSEDTLVGKWQEIDGAETMAFSKEGNVTIVPDDAPSMSGQYSFTDKDTVKIKLSGLVGAMLDPFILKVTVTKKELTVILPDGKTGKFKRVK